MRTQLTKWLARGQEASGREIATELARTARSKSPPTWSECPHDCVPLNMLAALLADYDRRMGGTVEPRDSMMLHHTDDCPHDQPKYGQIRAILAAAAGAK